MIEDFADILRDARPELTPSEARMAVYAASSLMRSVAARATSLDEATLQTMLSKHGVRRAARRAGRRGLRIVTQGPGGNSRCFDAVQLGGRFSIHAMIPSNASGCSPTHHVSFVSRLIAAGRSAASMKS